MMNNELRPYENYQVTGLDWLDKVPNHWNKISVRGITKLSNKRRGCRDDLQLLSVYREYGVIRKSSRNDNHNVESIDLSNYKYVDKGYLVLNKMKMWQGSLGISKYEGIVSPAYIVCKINEDVNLDYLHLLLRSPQYKTIYNRISYGVRVGQWDMRYDDLKNVPVFIPPRHEQDQIVKYLDHKLAKVNKFIKAKKKLIAVFNEQKQAIINQAVTKGIDPNVEMKPSGIDWLGDVPDHWNKNYLFQVVTEQFISNKNIKHQNLLSLSYGKIIRKDINRTDGLLPETYDNYQVVHEGNIILRMTDLQNDKKSLRVGLVEETGIITSAYICIKTRGVVNPEFLSCVLHSYDYMKVFYGMGGGVRQGIGYDDIKKLPILLPSIEEQAKIVSYIISQEASIVHKINLVEREIELLDEYKSSLISDVVTGKVDVRHISINESEGGIVEPDIDEELTDEGELDIEEGDE